jgi:hypothetical protein
MIDIINKKRKNDNKKKYNALWTIPDTESWPTFFRHF